MLAHLPISRRGLDFLLLNKKIAVSVNGINHGMVSLVVPLFPTNKCKPHRVSRASISWCVEPEKEEGDTRLDRNKAQLGKKPRFKMGLHLSLPKSIQ